MDSNIEAPRANPRKPFLSSLGHADGMTMCFIKHHKLLEIPCVYVCNIMSVQDCKRADLSVCVSSL